jgi:hypothetical protein
VFEPGVWYPLLQARPVPLFWRDPAREALLEWDARRQELRLDSPNMSLLGLGTADYPGYTIQLQLRQAPWGGSAGVFLGHHAVTVHGKPAVRCQVVCIKKDPRLPKFYVERFHRFIRTEDGIPVIDYSGIAVAPVPAPLERMEATLQVTVKRGQMLVVWDGNPLPALDKAEYRARTAPEDYVGRFGLFAERCYTVFRNPQIRFFARE